MKLVIEEKINKELKEKEFKWNFRTEEEGLYGIEITASCKSWWQNLFRLRSLLNLLKSGTLLKSLLTLRSFFFRDDDLAVKIDDTSFPKKSGKRGLFDGEVAWNGNNLKGLRKTDFFIVYFEPGTHTLSFLIDGQPKLETIRIYQIEGPEISYLPEDNNPPEDGDRRQWLTIVLANLGLNTLFIQARAEKGKWYKFYRDSEDLKLIINGEIQKNPATKLHRYWYWCGRMLKGESKQFDQELNLKPNLHYIELWADRSPEVEELTLKIKKERRATVEDPKWTGNFYDDSKQMVLARLIFGEARGASKEAKKAVAWVVKNRAKAQRWPDNYHEVILQKEQFTAFEEDNKNYLFVINPFHSKRETEKRAWEECYEVAGKVLKGELSDPTNGATHYHSDYIQPPLWTGSREIQFRIKIDNLLFYGPSRNLKNGKVGLKILIILFILLTGILVICWEEYKYIVLKREASLAVTKEAVFKKHFFIHPINGEVAVIHFDEKGRILRMDQLTSNGYPKSHLKLSWDREKIGYFQELCKQEEDFAYQTEQERREYYKNYTALMIMGLKNKNISEVYRGDYHISDWGWFSDDEVDIYRGCGTGCKKWIRINVVTGQREEEGVISCGEKTER